MSHPKRKTTRAYNLGVAESNKRRARHGMYKTRVHQLWRGMLNRCRNEKSASYARYGARGISVCERWLVFENFYADMGNPPDGMSLDRIDNSGNYSPDNCRWATPTVQQNNTRSNRVITYDGKTQTVAQWARELGIREHVIRYRARKGWKPPKLFSPDNLKGTTTKYQVMYNGTLVSIKEASRLSGVPLATLYWRLTNDQPLF
jgi:hypothetical protein